MKTLAAYTPVQDKPGLVPFVNVSEFEGVVRVMVRTAECGTIGTIMIDRDRARALFAECVEALDASAS